MKVINLSNQPVILRKNWKLVYVSHLAAEDFPVFQATGKIKEVSPVMKSTLSGASDLRLEDFGLGEIDIDLMNPKRNSYSYW